MSEVLEKPINTNKIKEILEANDGARIRTWLSICSRCGLCAESYSLGGVHDLQEMFAFLSLRDRHCNNDRDRESGMPLTGNCAGGSDPDIRQLPSDREPDGYEQ